ncbi:MAG: hypothetical protein V1726_01135 [Methanobacteriota archaeon]
MKREIAIAFFIGLLMLASHSPTSASNQENTHNHPQWSQLGPQGGTINVIVADPTNPDIFYAGTNTGVFKSIDSGYNWIEIGTNDLPDSSIVLSLAVDPYHPNILYCGYSGYYGPVLYKSINSGATWKPLKIGIVSGQGVPALIVDPVYDGYVYAGTTRGMYRSFDYGETWSFFGLDWKAVSSLSFNILPYQQRTISTPPKYILYASIHWPTGQIYRYQDGEWVQCSNGIADPQSFHPSQIVAAGNLVITGGMRYGLGEAYLYISTNQGNNWISVYPVISRSSQDSRIQQKRDTGLHYFSIKDKNNPLDMLTSPPETADLIITSILYEPFHTSTWGGPGTIYMGVANGILRAQTNDINTWIDISGDLHGLFVSSLAKTKDTFLAGTGYYLFGGFGDAGIFRCNSTILSPYYAEPWQPVHGISNSYVYSVAVSLLDPSKIVAGKDSGIYRTNTRGADWDRSSYQNYCYDYDILALQTGGIFTLAFDPNDENIVYGGSQTGLDGVSGILKSEDGGLNWETVLLYGGFTNTLAVDPENSQNIYVGYSSSVGGVLFSRDGGATWEFNPLESPILVLKIDPFNSNVIYGGGIGFYVSYDSGLTWNMQGLPDELLISLAIDPESHILYAGTAGNGVFKGTNTGNAWTPINNGLTTHLFISSLQLVNNNLYAGTYDGGVFVLNTRESPPKWESANIGLTNVRVTALAYSDALYAATYGSGIFRLDTQ